MLPRRAVRWNIASLQSLIQAAAFESALDDARNSTESRIDALLSLPSDPGKFPISRYHQHQAKLFISISKGKDCYRPYHSCLGCLAFVRRKRKGKKILAGRCRWLKKWISTNLIGRTRNSSPPSDTYYGRKQKRPLGCVDRKGYEGERSFRK